EEPEAIEAPEVEEIGDISHSDYDDTPENNYESYRKDEDEQKDEPQAPPSPTQRSKTVGKRPHTVQPTTARVLSSAQRKPTGVVVEVIASSNVSVDMVQDNSTGRESNTEHSRHPREHFQYPREHSQYPREHFRYGESFHTYRTYCSSPPSEVIGEQSMSSHQIPSSQLHGKHQSQRVHEVEYLPSSREEDESASMPKSDGILILGSEVSIPEDTHDIFENTGDIPSS
ncbi:uncharacterized protein H6S33_001839, partial [Morchella sextelata]|uniref:uncharacterized protein n=1 Tax=Morchella sextelata TaxID=1174677 RepID=UPI001D0460A6